MRSNQWKPLPEIPKPPNVLPLHTTVVSCCCTAIFLRHRDVIRFQASASPMTPRLSFTEMRFPSRWSSHLDLPVLGGTGHTNSSNSSCTWYVGPTWKFKCSHEYDMLATSFMLTSAHEGG